VRGLGRIKFFFGELGDDLGPTKCRILQDGNLEKRSREDQAGLLGMMEGPVGWGTYPFFSRGVLFQKRRAIKKFKRSMECGLAKQWDVG